MLIRRKRLRVCRKGRVGEAQQFGNLTLIFQGLIPIALVIQFYVTGHPCNCSNILRVHFGKG